MKKSDIQPLPNYFNRYIRLCEDVELLEGLTTHAAVFDNADLQQALHQLGSRVYAEGKWTAKDILQHIIDTERIMSYRALRFARNDQTLLPGFDEDSFARHTNANARTLEDLVEEFKAVRQATILMYRNFDDEMLLRQGICFGQTMTPLSLGFVLIGHPFHHLNILRERYFTLLAQ